MGTIVVAAFFTHSHCIKRRNEVVQREVEIGSKRLKVRVHGRRFITPSSRPTKCLCSKMCYLLAIF